MNNRQKAKHFKRLYEMGLPKKPYPVVYQTTIPRHYKAVYSMPIVEEKEFGDEPEVLNKIVAEHLINKLSDVIKDNIVKRKDTFNNRTIYELDIWMEH